MKKFGIFLSVLLVLATFCGCVGTTVVIQDCTCSGNTVATNPPAEGSLKTGLAVVASGAKSENAQKADYDVTVVAVLVDDGGVIQDCIIDGISAQIALDATGTITSDIAKAPQTKNELGSNYGMVQYGGAKYEWYQQAQALADFATGKTVAELKNGAIDETGKAPANSDLASTATIYLGGYVSAIEKAVNNAKHQGAQAGDSLKLTTISSFSSSTSATADKPGNAQLDSDFAALTEKDGVITSCYIDSLQAKVAFDTAGTITTDLSSAFKTKNELAESYGMVAWGGAKYEWYQQAESFCQYVTGKTAAQVAGIAVSEGKPSDADLATSVTISIAPFQALIAKAMQ